MSRSSASRSCMAGAELATAARSFLWLEQVCRNSQRRATLQQRRQVNTSVMCSSTNSSCRALRSCAVTLPCSDTTQLQHRNTTTFSEAEWVAQCMQKADGQHSNSLYQAYLELALLKEGGQLRLQPGQGGGIRGGLVARPGGRDDAPQGAAGCPEALPLHRQI